MLSLSYVARRLLLLVPVAFAASLLIFALIRIVPGDPVRTMLGMEATPEAVETAREQLGFNQPIVQQYLHWMGGVLRGDLGNDLISHEPLTKLLGQVLPVTVELAVLSLLIAVFVGVPLGTYVAARGRWAKRFGGTITTLGISIPEFWMGLMLVLLVAGQWKLLPPSGWTPISESLIGNLRSAALPVLTLAIVQTAYLMRAARGSVEAQLSEPHVMFLRAKGVHEGSIVYRHALRNAAGPIVTATGIQFGALLGGAIVIEQLFVLPGVGRLLVTSVGARNYVVVQGAILVVVVMYMLVNLLTDLVHAMIDPRIADAGAS